jgi:hypothetical protein
MTAALPITATSATLANIAEAMGVSKQATQKRANKEGWRYCGCRHRKNRLWILSRT